MSDQLARLPDESAPPRGHAAELNPQPLPPSPEWARSLPNGLDHRVKITEAYAKLAAWGAYFWAWPLVNIFNPRQAFKDVTEIVLAGAAPMAPLNNFGMLTDYVSPEQRLVACPNQDVVWNMRKSIAASVLVIGLSVTGASSVKAQTG
jgi:hypothetical protein